MRPAGLSEGLHTAIRNVEHSRSTGEAATPVIRMAMKTVSAELEEIFMVYLIAVNAVSCLPCLLSSPTLYRSCTFLIDYP